MLNKIVHEKSKNTCENSEKWISCQRRTKKRHQELQTAKQRIGLNRKFMNFSKREDHLTIFFFFLQIHKFSTGDEYLRVK